jgi:hypothetical protein
MITLILGLTGAGKTWIMTRLIKSRWDSGIKIYSNYKLLFDEENKNIERWWCLSDLYKFRNGVIAFDEGQQLLDARNWASLPAMFKDLICQHRHSFLDIYLTTQDIMQIDISVRRNVHELISCQSLLRFPRNDSVPPLFQWIRVQKKVRRFDSASDRVVFIPEGGKKWYFLSRLWTKKLYETYAITQLGKYVSKTIFHKKKWKTIIANRTLIGTGKIRGWGL